MKPRVIYMGTPDFAVPALQRLATSDLCDVALVVTQPDRAAGRGKKLQSPPVKTAADELGLEVVQTGTLRDPAVRQQITEIQPALVVVAAFGMILGRWILELPDRGCVNLHASLLPEYRGANPIAAAIALGEQQTGVTLMHMDRGLDTGGIYATKRIDIALDDTTESLTPKLASVAGDLLAANLQSLLDGTTVASPQPAGATLTRPMTKADGWMDWTRPAVELERHVRATWPWPRAWTMTSSGERMQILRATVVQDRTIEPGHVTNDGTQVVVGCGGGALELLTVQLPGRKPIEDHALVQSGSLMDGMQLGEVDAPPDLPPLITLVADEASRESAQKG